MEGVVMPKNKQEGVSGYAKSKKQTYKELEKAMDHRDTPSTDNAIDDMEREMQRASEEVHGMTDRIRNIFGDDD